MTTLTQPLRWTRLTAISLSVVILLGAVAAFAASPLGAQDPIDDTIFPHAELTGDQVVPPVASDGTGAFMGEGKEGGTELRFNLTVSVAGITQAHIHLGGPDENGAVVAFLFGPSDPPQDEVTIDGVLTEEDLLGTVAGDWGAFVEALFDRAYVQVHTSSNPAGELRGQIVVARPAPPFDPDSGSESGDLSGVQPATLGAFLDAVVEAGFGPLQLQEIAVTQPWIPVAGAGILILDGAQAEVYSLSAAQANEAVANISGEAGRFQPPANATVWRGEELIVVLRDAPSHPTIAAALSGILGSPVLATITGPPLPPPPVGGPGEGAPLVATSVAALADALRSAGLDILVTNTVVSQAWIPEGGVRLVVSGVGVDVFVLSSQDAVSRATATRKNGPLDVQPPANAAVWLNGTTFIVLADAPEHSEVSEAISALIGPPLFTTIAGSEPPTPPAALPSTGNGGLAAATDGHPQWIWLFAAGSLFLLAALGYGVISRWRRRFSSS